MGGITVKIEIQEKNARAHVSSDGCSLDDILRLLRTMDRVRESMLVYAEENEPIAKIMGKEFFRKSIEELLASSVISEESREIKIERDKKA